MSSGGGAIPGAPPSPVPGAGPEIPAGPAEPVALHDAAQAACQALKAARAAVEELQQQAELAEDIDPATEAAVDHIAGEIATLDLAMDGVEQSLGAGRQAYESDEPPDDEGAALPA